MFCFFSGTSPAGDLKMFLISHWFKIWEMRVAEAPLLRCLHSVPPWILFWDKHCPCSRHEGHTLYTECEEIKQGTLEGKPCVWSFLWALCPLEERQSPRTWWIVLHHNAKCFFFLCLVQLQWHTDAVWHQQVFQPSSVSGYFHARLVLVVSKCVVTCQSL